MSWEGIGIASYLLIGFWLTRIQANKAAVQAITVNRVGDIFITIGFFTILWVFSALDYSTLISISPLINESVLTIIGLLLFGGAISKSAQVPLHGWLPSAIEGKFDLFFIKWIILLFIIWVYRSFSNDIIYWELIYNYQ